MTKALGSSSLSSSVGPRGRGRVFGVPKRCWCGQSMWQLISKSEANPYRRYYRCAYAAAQKLQNDEHTFKWVDEAHLNEIEALKLRNDSLERDVKEIVSRRNEIEEMVFDNVERKLENSMCEKMDQSARSLKMIMIAVVLVCMIMIGLSKIVG